jgi:hypothetical protein
MFHPQSVWAVQYPWRRRLPSACWVLRMGWEDLSRAVCAVPTKMRLVSVDCPIRGGEQRCEGGVTCDVRSRPRCEGRAPRSSQPPGSLRSPSYCTECLASKCTWRLSRDHKIQDRGPWIIGIRRRTGQDRTGQWSWSERDARGWGSGSGSGRFSNTMMSAPG